MVRIKFSTNEILWVAENKIVFFRDIQREEMLILVDMEE